MDNLSLELENIGKAANEIGELAMASIGKPQDEIDALIEQIKGISKKYNIEHIFS